MVSALPAIGGVMDLIAEHVGWPAGMALIYMVAIVSGGLGYLVAAVCGLLPAAAWIAASERHRVRRPLAHVLAGGAGAVLGWLLLSFVTEHLGDPIQWRVAADLFLAGCIGGLVYWAMAGRTAGLRTPDEA
ncbi:hypothetical protein V5F59_02065 [Xanthobacter autotrophicus DSM 431]|uniref:hypothetical protein n=1 Tax=Xanthobacter nonsaccharivorans TaxID=3119912 RepID=UPI00372BEE32